MTTQRYEKLEDVLLKNIDDLVQPMDQHIINLVRAIQGLGLLTMGSCQGHLDSKHHPYSWVTFFSYTFPQAKYLLDNIGEYNKRSDIKWIYLPPNTIRTVEAAKDEGHLEKLQQSAEDFAKFLFYEVYLKTL